jgi:hypothetical protein
MAGDPNRHFYGNGLARLRKTVDSAVEVVIQAGQARVRPAQLYDLPLLRKAIDSNRIAVSRCPKDGICVRESERESVGFRSIIVRHGLLACYLHWCSHVCHVQ